MRKNGKCIETQRSFNKTINNVDLLFDGISDSLFIHELDGNIIKANKMACKCLGFTPEELCNMNIFTIGSTNLIHNYNNKFKKLKLNKRLRFETKHFAKNKKEIPVEVTSTLITVDNKEVILSSVRDISINKKYEQELILARNKAEESDRLKTAFIRNLSHEIRTPLNGILGFANFFHEKSYQLSAEKKTEFIEIINKSGERLINTIDQLVEISELDSKIIKLDKKFFYINDVFDLFITEQKRHYEKSKINFVYQIDPTLKNYKIFTDKSILLKVVKNLLSNAFKFTSEGTIKLLIQIKNNNLTFSIEDTGIGIDSKYHQIIYKPFSQVKNNLSEPCGGTGLGLTISKMLVTTLGGELFIKSALGKGTTFYFSLPGVIQTIPNSTHLKLDNMKKNTNLNGKTILIADDELVNYIYLEAVLLEEKCKLIHAFNGKEAVEIIMQNPNIDLILMDLKMPIMDGFEAITRIKKIRKNIPIIAQSAYNEGDKKERAMEAGSIYYLSKPINKNELISVITHNV